jgi:hypothetical protein
MKTIISKYSFLLAAAFIGSSMLAKAGQPVGHNSGAKIDTTVNLNDNFNFSTKKNVIAKVEKQKEREQLLDKLSKMPADFPEVFSNAKEEYLWKEKVKADQDGYDRRAKEARDREKAQQQ